MPSSPPTISPNTSSHFDGELPSRRSAMPGRKTPRPSLSTRTTSFRDHTKENRPWLFVVALGCGDDFCRWPIFPAPHNESKSSGPYDPKNPSPITFTIGNVDIVPLRNLRTAIGLCHVGIGFVPEDPNCENGPAKSFIGFIPWTIHWLDRDEKYLIALEEAFRNAADARKQIENADITIAISYVPWYLPRLEFWPLVQIRQFRFITKKLSDGRIYWTPTPLNDRGAALVPSAPEYRIRSA